MICVWPWPASCCLSGWFRRVRPAGGTLRGLGGSGFPSMRPSSRMTWSNSRSACFWRILSWWRMPRKRTARTCAQSPRMAMCCRSRSSGGSPKWRNCTCAYRVSWRGRRVSTWICIAGIPRRSASRPLFSPGRATARSCIWPGTRRMRVRARPRSCPKAISRWARRRGSRATPPPSCEWTRNCWKVSAEPSRLVCVSACNPARRCKPWFPE